MDYGYRECDQLGGHDPYSASKAAAELAIASWCSSFCGEAPHQTPYLNRTARSGNVIGGGDWAKDRILPDAMRAIPNESPILVRNPNATRPWQHVGTLSGYLILAESLTQEGDLSNSYNFGPTLDSNRSVLDLVEKIFTFWPGTLQDCSSIIASRSRTFASTYRQSIQST